MNSNRELKIDGNADSARLGRAIGCLAGQLAGDSLGSLVEFQRPERIRREHPAGVRELVDGGTWNTIAGQPTDDSEMALALARTLVKCGDFDAGAIRQAYVNWMNSGPFDIGNTTMSGLSGHPNKQSQANGALMRISPLGIFGAGRPLAQVSDWAAADAALTHPNPVCIQANRLYAMSIARAVNNGPAPADLYLEIAGWADQIVTEPALMDAIRLAADNPPTDYVTNQGWVLVAFQNALWELLHAPNLEEGIVDTIMRGGDTDTNACICGALLGAVYGDSQVPERWLSGLQSCRPEQGRPGVARPRPTVYWPNDFLELAGELVAAGRNVRSTLSIAANTRVPSICFVCEWNEGRSAHLELAVRHRLRNLGISGKFCSAGFNQGNRIYEARRDYLVDRGIPEAEIIGHRPTVFGKIHAGTDLVLVAELPMVGRLVDQWPNLRGRVMTIRRFAAGRTPDTDLAKSDAHIEDSAGHHGPEKMRLYDELETLADQIAARLVTEFANGR